jgi:hypothetical protein
MTTGEDGEVLQEKISELLPKLRGDCGGYWTTEAADLLALVMEENEALKHDLEQQMTIANIECNEAERLRTVLGNVRRVADRATRGPGPSGAPSDAEFIIELIDTALSPKSEEKQP